MRILVTYYEIADPGGIINHAEQLIGGLKDLGHDVDLCYLAPKAGRVKKRKLDNHEVGPSGYRFHQKSAWDGVRRYGCSTPKERNEWFDFTEQFDAVIHEVPLPPRNQTWKGNPDWGHFYHILPTQIGIVHDGNLPKLYPHIDKLPLAGLACVHHAAFGSAQTVPLPRVLIPNPQPVAPGVHEAPQGWGGARMGWFSCQTFKAWKHVDDLIRAVPYMMAPGQRLLAGGGIEYYYMTSETKVKDKYLNPDGTPIWQEAVRNGLHFMGYLTTDLVQYHMSFSRAVIDPSWSRKYAEYGSHFNRTTVEAMLQGAIPVARDLGLGTDRTGLSPFFCPIGTFSETGKKRGVYQCVAHDATPEEFAEAVDGVLTFNKDYANDIQRHNYEWAVKTFARKAIAQQYVELIHGTCDVTHGESTDESLMASHAAMQHYQEPVA